MLVSWVRQLLGRGLLRRRARHRACTLGACPRCGRPLGAREDWLEAERLVSEHLARCPSDGRATPRIAVAGGRPMLHSA